MDIYFNTPLDMLSDATGNVLPFIPELVFGDAIPIVFMALGNDNVLIDLSGAKTWELSIDLDRNSTTLPVCTVASENIVYDESSKSLSYTIHTGTLNFFAAVNGKSQVLLIAELCGFDSNGTRLFRFAWNMIGLMPVAGGVLSDSDPDSSTESGTVKSVNGVKPDYNGNVEIEVGTGTVKSVNGIEPDSEGNVELEVSSTEIDLSDYKTNLINLTASSSFSVNVPNHTSNTLLIEVVDDDSEEHQRISANAYYLNLTGNVTSIEGTSELNLFSNCNEVAINIIAGGTPDDLPSDTSNLDGVVNIYAKNGIRYNGYSFNVAGGLARVESGTGKLPSSIIPDEGMVKTVNGIAPDQDGDIELGNIASQTDLTALEERVAALEVAVTGVSKLADEALDILG